MQSLPSSEAEQPSHLRLLENWLPLAQAENSAQDWGLNGKQIEALIIQAAPALRIATNQLAARAILWHHHRQIAQEAA